MIAVDPARLALALSQRHKSDEAGGDERHTYMSESPTYQAIILIDELKSLKNERDTLLWREGRIWHTLKEKKLFSYTEGPQKQKKSWKAFVNEMGEPLPTVEFKIALYKKWIEELGYSVEELKDIHTRKLHRAIPYVNSKEDAEKVLAQARALSFDAFLKWLKREFVVT